MEEESLEVSDEYKRWFNRGYELRKTMPEVFNNMKTPQNEPKGITQAFEAGVKQFERENVRDQLREQMERKFHDRDHRIDRGR